MKPIGSEITGSPSLALAEQKPTGTQLGVIGSGAPRPPLRNSDHLPVMHQALLTRAPAGNTDALRSRLLSFGFDVNVKTSLSFPTDPVTGERKGWRVTGTSSTLTAQPHSEPEKARQIIEAGMAPAAIEDIEAWLGELSLVTARKTETGVDAVLTIKAYCKRLKQYPGDVVRHTLENWTGKWFPSWGELEAQMESEAAIRRAIAVAFERWERSNGNGNG